MTNNTNSWNVEEIIAEINSQQCRLANANWESFYSDDSQISIISQIQLQTSSVFTLDATKPFLQKTKNIEIVEFYIKKDLPSKLYRIHGKDAEGVEHVAVVRLPYKTAKNHLMIYKNKNSAYYFNVNRKYFTGYEF